MEAVLKSGKFQIKETIYEVVATSIGDSGVYNAIDTIQNLTTKEKKTMRRAEVLTMVKKYNGKFI